MYLHTNLVPFFKRSLNNEKKFKNLEKTIYHARRRISFIYSTKKKLSRQASLEVKTKH